MLFLLWSGHADGFCLMQVLNIEMSDSVSLGIFKTFDRILFLPVNLDYLRQLLTAT